MHLFLGVLLMLLPQNNALTQFFNSQCALCLGFAGSKVGI